MLLAATLFWLTAPATQRRFVLVDTTDMTHRGFLPLIYHGRPLPDVIQDVRPYTRRRIRVDASVAEFQYSGIVKQEDVDAWLRDLAAIYPLDVIDCRAIGSRRVPACADPELIIIRSRFLFPREILRSAMR